MPGLKNGVTAAQVARHAGLSDRCVGLYLQGGGPGIVSEATAARIRKAITEVSLDQKSPKEHVAQRAEAVAAYAIQVLQWAREQGIDVRTIKAKMDGEIEHLQEAIKNL